MTSSDDFKAPRWLAGTGGWLDDRFGGARGIRQLLKKVFPDHWSFMLGEIALYSFVILLLTGTFLSFFFVPSAAEIVYHGSYTKLDGIRMSQAYASTLNISFDVRAGLLMRQIHHWSADLFMASIIVHLLRNFFTGAFRKPREVTWLIGVVIFMLGLLEGLFGYSLPDDQLSGAGIRILEGVLLGIPIVGTYAAFFLFGGQYPGTAIIPRMYIIHVLLIPGILLALITAHLIFVFYQKHTAMPAINQTDRIETGQPFYPYFLAKTTAWFFFVFAACAILATFAQINPVWQYGPYTPIAISSASQPDFYMGFLEGALRMMPAWEWNFLGHTISFSVLIPFAVPAGIIFGGLLFWPFFEQWATGDRSYHHVNDRPRNAPIRTATGIAGVVFYGVLWAEGANDVIADKLQIPLYTVTWIARVLIFVGPRRGRRTSTACPHPSRAAPSAGPGAWPTAPSPRRSWSRPTGTVTATATGTRRARSMPSLAPVSSARARSRTRTRSFGIPTRNRRKRARQASFGSLAGLCWPGSAGRALLARHGQGTLLIFQTPTAAAMATTAVAVNSAG